MKLWYFLTIAVLALVIVTLTIVLFSWPWWIVPLFVLLEIIVGLVAVIVCIAPRWPG